VVNYGENEKTTLQFYVTEPLGTVIQRHSTFLVEKQQWNTPGKIYDKVFDDWLMEKRAKRESFSGYWGWGDDWGYVMGPSNSGSQYSPTTIQMYSLDDETRKPFKIIDRV
jgi:hypothetical protein